jgi:hypothetical protein
LTGAEAVEQLSEAFANFGANFYFFALFLLAIRFFVQMSR